MVSTIAGVAGAAGLRDGNATSSLFNTPRGLAIDSAGDIIVCDSKNNLIRKISLSGQFCHQFSPFLSSSIILVAFWRNMRRWKIS
jgi:hypothetical protein